MREQSKPATSCNVCLPCNLPLRRILRFGVVLLAGCLTSRACVASREVQRQTERNLAIQTGSGSSERTASAAEDQRNEDGSAVEFTHATMSDGVKIALAVGYPKGFDPEDQNKKWPTVFEMSGYQAATKPAEQQYFDGLYVTVNASLRGTGASGGRFSVFSDRSTTDGHEIIEEWIVKQPWSNGKVGIHGHSWPGLTGFRVAATNPPHLSALVVSGLFDDALRGLAGIGGIRNIGFPVRWSSNFQRADGVFGSDDAAIENRNLSEAEARQLRASRERLRELGAGPAANRRRTLRELAGQIRAPIFLLHAYQDQQTGASGVWLFDALSPAVPRRLLISNGHHGMPLRFIPHRRAWFDYWLLGKKSKLIADVDEEKSRVEAWFEVENRFAKQNAPFVSSDFPLPETHWTRYYLSPENTLSTTPAADTSADAYEVVSDTRDDQINRVEYRRAFDQPTAICGPIPVTLWASCTAADTDLFVVLSDIAPDGRVRALQRGMLRASMRSVDEQRSSWVSIDGERVIVRPYHSFENPEPLEPGKPYRFDIEVFPLGHVFRDGHQLSLSISKPPLSDPVAYPKGKKGKIRSGSFRYESKQPDSTVTLHCSPEYPSSVLLPVLPDLPPISDKIPASIDRMWTKAE